jgi:hypothetical protein
VSGAEPTAGGRPPDTAWFHCFAGIAGDMALGSLIDAGADLDEITAILLRLRLPGWELTAVPAVRSGLSSTRAVVTVGHDGTERRYAGIVELIKEAALPDRVERRALAVFSRLAVAEGSIHGVTPGAVHFHEVGGHDAIIDIVGTVAALEVLGIDHVFSSPVATGTGTVRTAHGILPNPSPAVVNLLRGASTFGRMTGVELTTPTGAALIAELSLGFGPMPAMEIVTTGFGAGASELDELPNCTQVVLGRSVAADIGPGQPMIVLEANLDDVTGEELADAVTGLLEAGARDAWVTAVVMKKGRPAHTLHALCEPATVAALREVFGTATGTLGVRATTTERWSVPRSSSTVTVAGEPISMKVGPHRAKPEHDDVVRTSGRTGLSVHEVTSRAEEEWRRSGQEGAAGSAIEST